MVIGSAAPSGAIGGLAVCLAQDRLACMVVGMHGGWHAWLLHSMKLCPFPPSEFVCMPLRIDLSCMLSSALPPAAIKGLILVILQQTTELMTQ